MVLLASIASCSFFLDARICLPSALPRVLQVLAPECSLAVAVWPASVYRIALRVLETVLFQVAAVWLVSVCRMALQVSATVLFMAVVI